MPHRFRGFERRWSYTRRLPCRPWLIARVQVVKVLPASAEFDGRGWVA
jgi:hypothetical protein